MWQRIFGLDLLLKQVGFSIGPTKSDSRFAGSTATKNMDCFWNHFLGRLVKYQHVLQLVTLWWASCRLGIISTTTFEVLPY